MKFEILAVTTKHKDYDLHLKLNFNSNAIIANQTEKNEIKIIKFNNHVIKYISTATQGVGINRNIALINSSSDICLLCDDDIKLDNDTEIKILRTFLAFKNVDVIIFNLNESNSSRFLIKKTHRINCTNFMRYGAPRIAFRRSSIINNNISFNLNFGGGCKYGSGEDTLFLKSCLDSRLKIIAYPISIGMIEQKRSSSWFRGFNDKFYFDKGALFYALSKTFYFFLVIRFLVKFYKLYEGNKNFFTLFQHMLSGAAEAKYTL
jgi:glycosyltransferase involved in cell wall biosynthesis